MQITSLSLHHFVDCFPVWRPIKTSRTVPAPRSTYHLTAKKRKFPRKNSLLSSQYLSSIMKTFPRTFPGSIRNTDPVAGVASSDYKLHTSVRNFSFAIWTLDEAKIIFKKINFARVNQANRKLFLKKSTRVETKYWTLQLTYLELDLITFRPVCIHPCLPVLLSDEHIDNSEQSQTDAPPMSADD